MDIENETGALEASFELVARQEAAEAAIAGLRGEVDEVKGRLDRLGRAPRAPLAGGERSPEVKGFVDGYLRQGRESEVKSIQGTVPGDGGYAVPHELDAAIGRQLTEISPIRRIAQVVHVGSAGYRKLMSVSVSGRAAVSLTHPLAEPPTLISLR